MTHPIYCIGPTHSDTMFRFTIRELILLTVIVAMGAAWWVDRRNILYERSIWEAVARDAANDYEGHMHARWSVTIAGKEYPD